MTIKKPWFTYPEKELSIVWSVFTGDLWYWWKIIKKTFCRPSAMESTRTRETYCLRKSIKYILPLLNWQSVCGNQSSGTFSPEKKTFCLSKVFRLNSCRWSTFVSGVNQIRDRNKNWKLPNNCITWVESSRATTFTTVFSGKKISWTKALNN